MAYGGYSRLDDALLQQALSFGLDKPSTSEFDFLHQWLSGTKMSGCFLVGREQHVWDAEKRADLVTLRKAQARKDGLSSWLTGSFLKYFHRSVGHYIMVGKRLDTQGWNPIGLANRAAEAHSFRCRERRYVLQ